MLLAGNYYVKATQRFDYRLLAYLREILKNAGVHFYYQFVRIVHYGIETNADIHIFVITTITTISAT